MMPLLLLVIFGYAANFYVSSLKAAVVGPQSARERCCRTISWT
jgi:ABC-2 type transport system permease protein